jgi:hypothetical protein
MLLVDPRPNVTEGETYENQFFVRLTLIVGEESVALEEVYYLSP